MTYLMSQAGQLSWATFQWPQPCPTCPPAFSWEAAGKGPARAISLWGFRVDTTSLPGGSDPGGQVGPVLQVSPRK